MKQNLRADDMWQIIMPTAKNWFEKTVVDMGCGWGDMTHNVLRAGAHKVVAIDKGDKQISTVADKCREWITTGRLYLVNSELKSTNHLDQLLQYMLKEKGVVPNTFFLFSVLPYFDDPESILKYLSCKDAVTFIEMQYADDGPGPKDIMGDIEMRLWLHEMGFDRVQNLGYTHIEGRNMDRTIWLCLPEGVVLT